MSNVIPTKKTIVDDRNGNTFIIMEVVHSLGDSIIDVPDSAVSVAELPAANGVAPSAIQSTSPLGSDTATVTVGSGEMCIQNTTAGTSPGGFSYAAGDGVKQVIIDDAVTSGTYQIVVRCVGGGAGTGGANQLDL